MGQFIILNASSKVPELEDSLLPLVTAKTQLNGGEVKTIDVFFDSSSQQNFIQEEIATKLKLKTVQDGVAITKMVSQALESKSLTHIVQIPLTFADQTSKVRCICIKSLPANFKVHQMGDLIQTTQASNLTLAFK